MRRIAWLMILCFSVAGLTWSWMRPLGERHDAPVSFMNQRVEAKEGDKLCRPDGRPWARKTVLLVSTATCPACGANRSFEQEIEDLADKRGLDVVYVLSNEPESDLRAAELSSLNKSVLRADLHRFGIYRIPSAVRIDDTGIIESVWSGTVPTLLHENITNSVLQGESLQGYTGLNIEQLSGYDIRGFQLVGFATMSALPSELSARRKIIPIPELPIRAKYETDRNAPGILLDCTSTTRQSACQEAALTLAKMNFKHVVALGLESIGQAQMCSREQ